MVDIDPGRIANFWTVYLLVWLPNRKEKKVQLHKH
jgi:hypothetical protein